MFQRSRQPVHTQADKRVCMLQANTVHFAALATMGANKLRGGSSGLRGYKQDKLTIATTAATALACLHGYHGFKSGGGTLI
jgi:hypothetical protein